MLCYLLNTYITRGLRVTLVTLLSLVFNWAGSGLLLSVKKAFMSSV